MPLSKKSKSFIAVGVVLVAAPYVGHVDGIDLSLYRGAYQIIDMRVFGGGDDGAELDTAGAPPHRTPDR